MDPSKGEWRSLIVTEAEFTVTELAYLVNISPPKPFKDLEVVIVVVP